LGVLRWATEHGEELGIAQRLGRSFRAVAVLIALALALAIATLIAVLAIYQPSLVHYADGRTGARTARQAMADQETALRGYLIAGTPGFLAAYRTGQVELIAGHQAIDDNLGGNSGLAPLVDATRQAEQAWTNGWAQPVAAAPAPEGSGKAAVLGGDVPLFASYRKDAIALSSAISSRYDEVRRDETIVLATGAGLQALLFCVLFVYAIREQQRLRVALVRPFATLLGTMRRVRDGDLAARAAVEGPTEVRMVATTFNEMTQELAEERSLRASRETEAIFQATALRGMLDMARNLAGSLNLRYVLDAVSTHAVSLSGFEQATVWLTDEEQRVLVAVVTATAGGTGPSERGTIELERGCVGQAARFGRVVTTMGGGPSDPPGAQSVMAVPMVVGARVVGAIELSSQRDYVLPNTARSLVEMLASHAGTAIEAARLHARTEELSQVDSLTRLFNRRRLESDLDREWKRSQRYDRPLAFCMLDVDHFKQFNDRHGHRRGDDLLEEVGQLLRSGVRSSDSAYRYGGEEFVLLLRDTTLDAAAALCERLRVRIAEQFAGESAITASFGVAEYQPDMHAPADLVEAADRALYQAKSAGRNLVVAGDDPLPQKANKAGDDNDNQVS
jgi:diguanylate cyclase (GGDEF)-like protein